MEPRSTRDIPEMLLKLIVKVPVVGITADTPNPPGRVATLLKEIWESPRDLEVTCFEANST